MEKVYLQSSRERRLFGRAAFGGDGMALNTSPGAIMVYWLTVRELGQG